MGLILPQEVEVKVSPGNHVYYRDIGYKIPFKNGWDKKDRIDFNSTILVDVNDLPYRSQQTVRINCDYCGKEDFLMYRDVYRQINSVINVTKICCTNPKCKKQKASDVRIVNSDKRNNPSSVLFRNKDWLYNEYIIKDKSAESISEETGAGLRTIRRYLKNFNLTTKNGSKTSFITKEDLLNYYIDKRMTTFEIGELYGLCDGTILNLLNKYNIKRYTHSEQMQRYYYEKGGRDKSIKYANRLENRIKTSCNIRKIKVEDFTGFVLDENKKQRSGYKYKDWRKAVFIRDNYTCVCCGKRGGELHAHHIENFSSNEEKRLDISNGVTMCFNCHSVSISGSFHNLYGVRNNNVEQLNEYIKTKKSIMAN